MSDTPPTLQTALLKAQQALSAIPKESRNEFDRFDYASAETILRECRKPLHDAGLVAYADGNTVSGDYAATGTGVIDASFVLSCPASGELERHTSQMPFTLRKGWPAEKAVAASLTHALKFWLCRLLLVPRVDKDAELDAIPDADFEPSSAKPRAKPIPTDPGPEAVVGPPMLVNSDFKPLAAQRRPRPPAPPPHGMTTGAAPPPKTEPSKPASQAAPTLDPRVPAERSLVSIGKMLLEMAGGDKARAAEICDSIHGVKSLRDIGDVELAWGGTVEAFSDYLGDKDEAEVEVPK